MSTNDPLCIPVDPHDYEHREEPEGDDEFVSLADAAPAKTGARVSPDEELLEHPGD
jgi:hypothetical protein